MLCGHMKVSPSHQQWFFMSLPLTCPPIPEVAAVGAQPRHGVTVHKEGPPHCKQLLPTQQQQQHPPTPTTSGIFLGFFCPPYFHAVSKPSVTGLLSMSFLFPKPWSTFVVSPKTHLHLGSQWGDGGVILSVHLPQYMWGVLPLTTRFGAGTMFNR